MIILPEWALWVVAAMFTISAVLTCIQIYCRNTSDALKRNKETLRMIKKYMDTLEDREQ